VNAAWPQKGADTTASFYGSASLNLRAQTRESRHPRIAPASIRWREGTSTSAIGFLGIGFSLLAVSAFSTAPRALYGLYAQRDHLSSLTITVVYAVYAAGIVVALVLAGHVSDWYSRRVGCSRHSGLPYSRPWSSSSGSRCPASSSPAS